MEHISFESLEENGHIPLSFHSEPETRPFYACTPQENVPTPSGKIEFLFSSFGGRRQGIPLPGFTPPTESRWCGRMQSAIRWSCWHARPNNYMNSTFANLDTATARWNARTSQQLEIHPRRRAKARANCGRRAGGSGIQRSRSTAPEGDAGSQGCHWVWWLPTWTGPNFIRRARTRMC